MHSIIGKLLKLPILLNEPTTDKLLKLLLPLLKFRYLMDFLGLEVSLSCSTLTFATTSWAMLLLQNEQIEQ